MGGMAEEGSSSRRPGFVQTLREGWKSPRRRSKTTELPTESSKTTEEAAATKPTNGAEAKLAPSAKPAATTTAATAGSKPPEPNLNERMEGLQGWMAEIERKQGRITFFSTVGIAIAVLAAGAALYFAIATPNSASKDDFDDLESEVRALQDEVSEATQDQASLKQLRLSIQSLDSRIAAAEQKGNQNAAEIATLKRQAAQAAATPAPAPTPTPALPPTTPKPGSNP
jgi:uncharacterized protein YdcH (DUF465 family)